MSRDLAAVQSSGTVGVEIEGGEAIATLAGGVCEARAESRALVGVVEDGVRQVEIVSGAIVSGGGDVIVNVASTIGRTSIRLAYDSIGAAKCKIWVRKETPLGAWIAQTYAVLESDHNHVYDGLVTGQWYHLKIELYEGTLGWWPVNDPLSEIYRRFKTAGPGEEPGIWQE